MGVPVSIAPDRHLGTLTDVHDGPITENNESAADDPVSTLRSLGVASELSSERGVA